MNQNTFNQLYKSLKNRMEIERPTYLTDYQAFESLILNIKDNRVFTTKRSRRVSAEKYEKELRENQFIFESIINMYYLIFICDGGKHEKFGLYRPLKRQERKSIAFGINWILQGKLTKHRDRIKQFTNIEFTKKLDMIKTVSELLAVNKNADMELLMELNSINKRISSGMSDKLLVQKFIELEKKYWGYFNDIKIFKTIYSDFKEMVIKMFEKQIYLGYKEALQKLIDSEYIVTVICSTLLTDFLLYLGLDKAIWSPNEFYQRVENVYNSFTKPLNYIIEFFENEVSEDISPVDVTLMLSPLITFQKNLDIQLKQYKKKFGTNIKQGSQKRKDYERIWIRELYKDIKKDCEGKNIRYKKEYDEILYEIMYHIGLVFDEFNKVCKSQFNHAEYSYENLKKMTRGL